ncbi:alpha/beta hydrolase [Sphingomonas endophytica]|uniref:Acetyl esterase/lipase n=1 Tax=Sphingomonas endophytica TaxID=869719 RepID=A0ABR6N2T3_9SPHN|nr:alpha/beta hydrolase [Sphingomonas endophytica]MBB5724510.1 acetyl esterase/lipase [Sphingomonas endophytica]
MHIDRRALIGGAASLATLAMTQRATAQDATATTQWPPREHFKLWPDRPPNSPRRLPTPNNEMNGQPPRRELHLRGVAEPVVGVYRPARPDGRALLSLPGGGYRFLSVENEGINVARTFNPLGVTVFVLAYRLPGEGWLEPQDVPLQDAQRAMRLIRARAADFAIDPAGLGVVGFSAGGLLAASIATAYADPVYDRVDAADDQPARPAFAGLVYPVITGDMMRVGALGAARFDTDRRVNRGTPPIFIAHALDDPVVPAAQPMAMLAACQAARVPVEAHFFQEGGHGFGPAYLAPELPGSHWPQLFDLFVKRTLASRTTG